ncbi:hypothetical protein [Caballeronia sp. AZ10_KS36]|uniref:glycine-rich domain-containing protein n=1 Tax=Caballeronia sp. AZ10_KS36 TaxID=2921757 RepID=UPI00202801E2|nr:hypothetical protein [Caballeronia sp. AZ10_KS36]
MFRIDDATAASSLPTPEAAGTEGYWTEGNPATGTPATLVRASFLNMVQEELRAIVVAGGLTPSKTAYNQVLSAIKALTNGKLLNVQTFTSNGTYTPTAGTKFVIVEVLGGAGSGGGCAATGASQISVGSGGCAGAYAKALITSGFSGVAVTVGVGGAPASGFASNPGTASSFGSLVSCPGGLGGTSAGPTTPPWFTGVNTSAAPTGGNITGAAGASGGISVALSTTAGYGAAGGSSPFGGGGGPGVINVAGLPSPSQGAGGGGSMLGPSQSAIAGGRGGNGVVIVYEFGAAT